MADKNQKSNQDQAENDSIPNLHFNVMPDLENIGKMPDQPRSSSGLPPAPPPTTPMPGRGRGQMPAPPRPPGIGGLTQEIKGRREDDITNPSTSWYKNRKFWIVVSVTIVLVIAAIAAAFVISRNQSESTVDQTPEDNETVDTPAVDTSKDTDDDGLTDAEEEDLGTDVNHADTDNDGLSDGDEVKLFQTSPLTLHSDADRYDDGKEVRDGYTPLTAGDSAFTETEIEQVVTWFKDGKVHEPTRTKLLTSPFWQKYLPFESGNETPGNNNGESFAYEDPVYGYQIVIPGQWRLSGENPTNIVFIEKDSPSARYVQIQAFVAVDESGNVTGKGLIEEEIKRLAKISTGSVSFREATVGGLRSYRLSSESERASSNPDSAKLLSANVEYIVETNEATFFVTAACTSDTSSSCMPSLEILASGLETNLRF